MATTELRVLFEGRNTAGMAAKAREVTRKGGTVLVPHAISDAALLFMLEDIPYEVLIKKQGDRRRS